MASTPPTQMTRLQGQQIDLSRLQDNINQAIGKVSDAANSAMDTANGVTANGIAAGVLGTMTVPAAGGVISNPLGQKIQGLIVVYKTTSVDLYLNPNQGTLDPTKQISVLLNPAPSGPVKLSIWFF